MQKIRLSKREIVANRNELTEGASMGAEIDRLEIQVETQAASANKQLDNLVTKLNAISKSLSGINGGGMKQFAEGMNRITAASKTMSTIKTTEINRVVSNLQKLSKVNSGNMFNVGNALKNFASGLSVASSVNVSGIAQMTSSIAGLSKFGNKGVQAAITSMPKLASVIKRMMAALNGQAINASVVTHLTAIANAVSVFGQKRMQTAIVTMPQLATALKSLMSTLSAMPNVSSDLIQMTNALANLAAQGAKTKSAVNAIKSVGVSSASSSTQVRGFSSEMTSLVFNTASPISGFKKLVSVIGAYTSKIAVARRRTRSLSQVLGSFNASFYPIIRGVRALGKAVEKSMDYVETYNYFNVTMAKIGKEFGNQYSQYGYDSAEAYADSFSSRLNGLTEKMSGYKVGGDGVLSFSNAKNLSLDPEQLIQYQSNIAAVTNSVGLVGETSINAAKALSMLTADMSSLKNIDMSTVMNNFQSGLIGQSRALYKYGIDITNATLQTYAYKHGLSMAVSEMTQADKMQLRLLAILDQSKVAWGDQANTINSVANQYRIFKQQISNVARVIGNLFIPVLQAILPVVNGVLIAFQKLVVFIGSLFGIDYSKIMDGISGGYSGMDDSMGDIADETDDVADSTGGIGNSLDDANDKAKKLQRTILGFDQINKLSDNEETSTSGNGGGSGLSGGGAGGIDLSGAIAKALTEYEKVWNEALQNSVNKAQEYADKITSIFSKMWKMIKSGDFVGLGKYAAGGVNQVFEAINKAFNWEKLGPGITRFVNAYCDTVNSLVDNIDWNLIGKTIGDGINVVTNTLYRYLTGIDWINIGTSIATGLNGMIQSIDWDMLGQAIGAWIMKIPKMIYGFVTKLDWKGLGKGLGKSLNGALKKFDGKMIAKGINGIVNGILEAIKSFIKTVKWDEVAKAVGDILGNLDWGTLAKVGLAIGAVKLVAGLASLLKAASYEAIKNAFGKGVEAALKGLGKTLGKLFTKELADGTIMTGFKALAANISVAFSGAIPTITTALSGVITAIGTFIAGLSGPVLLAIGAAIAGIIAIICNWDKVKEFFTKTLPNWWNSTVVPWIQGLPEFFKELPGKILEKIITLKDKFVEWASGIIETVTTEVPKIIGKITGFFAELPGKIGYAIGFAAGKIVEWGANLIATITTEVPKIISSVVGFFEELPGKIWDAIIFVKDKIVEWGTSVIATITTEVPKIISSVVGFFEELPGKVWTTFSSIVGKVGTWSQDMIAKVKEVFPQVISTITDFFKDLPSKFIEYGKNIVQGLIDGVNDMFAEAKKTFTDFVDGFTNGFKDALGINSPSTVFKAYGKNTMKGYEQGVEGEESTISSKFGNIVNTLLGKFSTVDKDYSSQGMKMMRGLITGINNQYGALDTLIGKMPEKLVTAFENGGPVNKFTDRGKEIVNGLKSGISNNLYTLTNYLNTISSKIENAMGNLYNSGRNVMQDFVNGMKSVYVPTPHMYTSSWSTQTVGDTKFSTPNFSVKWYAKGGFPNVGQLFMARESGPEMVGTMGGRTTVANNDQIVDGIKAGVKAAVVEAMLLTGGNKQAEAPVIEFSLTADSETIYKLAQKGKQKAERRYSVVATV